MRFVRAFESDEHLGVAQIGMGGLSGSRGFFGRNHLGSMGIEGRHQRFDQIVHVTETSDGNLHRGERLSLFQGLEVSNGGDSGTVPGLARQNAEVIDHGAATNAVDIESGVGLEVAKGPIGERSEDSVDATTVEPESRQHSLKFGDIVTPKIR